MFRIAPWSLLLSTLMVIAAPSCAAPASAAPGTDLHDAMAAALAAQDLQGAVWSTLATDGTIAADAAGVRDARTGAALRADDRVHVGSVAKTLLATGVLRLVSERRLALDTPVGELLPELAIDNPWASTHPVTVRHLLDHTAGLDDARLSQVFSLQARADAPLASAFAERPLRVRSVPGRRHSYSNSGYTLLAMIVERVTGDRYEAWLARELLQPLGMRDSTFEFTTQVGDDADPRLAMGHFEAAEIATAVPAPLRPSMQFTTTAADMARFARFLLSDGRVDGEQIVDADLLRAMGTPVGTEAADAALRVGYGLGLATRDRHGVVGRCHGGSTVGYRAMFCLFPDTGRAFFVSVNADREDGDYGVFDRLLIEALRVPSPPVIQAGTDVAAVPADWAGWYVPAPNRFASFAWLDATLGFVRVGAEGDGLAFAPFQGTALALAPAGGNLMRGPDRTSPSHALIVAVDGTRVISTGLQSWERIPLPTLAALWLSLAAGLAGMLWLLCAGLVRLVVPRAGGWRRPATLPFLGIVALVLPVPLFLRQSFLAMGDLTAASGLLAVVTALLPLTLLAGLALTVRRGAGSKGAIVDAVSLVAVLQWTAVLA